MNSLFLDNQSTTINNVPVSFDPGVGFQPKVRVVKPRFSQHPPEKHPDLADHLEAGRSQVATWVSELRSQLLEPLRSEMKFSSCEHRLRLALNEAEAVAWQTPFPHLVLPELVAEKISQLRVWCERQQALWRGQRPVAWKQKGSRALAV